MLLILAVALSYFIGSIPSAYLLGKLIKGVDIRKHGSGNVGATNAFRVLGPGVGITVLFLDALKGFICVVAVSDFLIKQGLDFDSLLIRILLGVTAVLGHSLTIFLRFRGGKGMATTLGVLIGLAAKIPALKIILLAEILIWWTVFLLSRIVSLASVVSAIFFPIIFIILRQPMALIIMSLLLGIFVIIRHKSNINRLLHKQEPRLSFRHKA